MTNTVARSRSLPWYREPWPWFLIALPATVIVGCTITLWLAVSTADGMVARDYYKQGLAINGALARVRHASDLGLHADVQLSGYAGGDRVRVRVSAARPLPAETALKLAFVHPARDGADRTLLLARVRADGNEAEYSGQFIAAEPMAPVAWQVVLETPNWRLDGQMHGPHEHSIRLDAAP